MFRSIISVIFLLIESNERKLELCFNESFYAADKAKWCIAWKDSLLTTMNQNEHNVVQFIYSVFTFADQQRNDKRSASS